ncbi:hypothetical protein FFLO_01297 [Filobasidium floriforme]|uniref:Alkaline phosphatase D n=1 Tax=Filobasidium floriforme TaxID=5210 RepID=A0A8K0JPS2_9TREE|nr:hypothetical protein FFLO_01297 [Filobasidium floriforme]
MTIGHLFMLASALLPLALAGNHLDANNLVYRSPYTNHDGLALDTHAIAKRHDQTSELLRKRQLSQPAPEGDVGTYTLSGYGLGATDWSNSDRIYAGDVNFTHSVASGDPYDYSVLLWTRAEPTAEAPVDIPVCVTYKVYTGQDGTGSVVASGHAFTSYDVDFTVKVEATGLTALTPYSYQFANCAKPDQVSPVGKTRTAPGKFATDIPTQKFAVYSCANWPNGFFNSYSGPVTNGDSEYVIALGDYIYEYGTGGDAINRTNFRETELASLDDYRVRYQQYRTDPDLSASHQNLPWIAVWDDHETANNDWKAGSQNSNNSYPAGCSYGNQTGICFDERAANAKRAYHEWMPIRQVDLSDEGRIWRDFAFGDLLDIIALDTRKYDRDITDLSPTVPNKDYVASLAVELNSSRSITGPVQELWMLDTIKKSHEKGTKWRLLMNQVIFGSINHTATSTNPTAPGVFDVNYDAWDGYQGQRQRILNRAYDDEWRNLVIVTGDTHSSWLHEIERGNVLAGSTNVSDTLAHALDASPGYKRGRIVEFGGTAVSSNGWGATWKNSANATERAAKQLVQNSGSLLYSEGFYRGYMNVEVSYTNITTKYYAYEGNQERRTQNRSQIASFVVPDGVNMVQRPIQVQAGAVKPGN